MASPSTTTNTAPHPQQLRLYLHSELTTSHTTHGITHEDYIQYSTYCTRRLARLRHSKSVKKDLLHVRLYKSSLSTKTSDSTTTTTTNGGSKAKKNSYRAIELTNLPSEVLASHVNYFLEPLYCAERCWAASLALKAEMTTVIENDAANGANTNALGSDGLNPRKDWSVGKFRAQSMKRLKKAVKYATLVESLALSTKAPPSTESKDDNNDEEDGATTNMPEERMVHPPVDEHTQMEARAYASFMRGNLALEMNQWQTACTEYQMAMQLCEALGQGLAAAGGTSSGGGSGADDGVDVQQLELFDFFNSRAKNVIAPLLKYCHYELQEKGLSPTEKISFLQSSSSISDGDPLQSKLHSLKNETLQTQATSGSSMSQITFRENVIPVETKDLRMALLKIQDLKSDWEEEEEEKKKNDATNSSSDDAKFMELLSGYDDAVSLVNKELKQLAALKSGPAVNAKKFQLVNLLGYSKYQKLKLVMGRNEVLTNGIIQTSKEDDEGMTLKHLEEVAHLYDALLQDARAVASLPGGGSADDFDGDSSSAIVEDEFYLEANANVLRLRSLRCYYLARMHASPVVHKYSEAIALLDQAERLANEALEEIGACDQMEHGDALLESLEKVAAEMRGEKCRVLALSYLSKSSSTGSGKCLLQRLHDYNIPSSPKSIAHVPPKLEPMACKPSFFDVALNYVSEYPADELERAMEEHNGAETASSGILGWFRRG
eukprot:CAMPEP_0113414812 /NCGR_PEP_ID=MMETSP0013_2-20120614/24226_1 /TAXON_ID=2843 ORGANISM="Skeletonema costatum, Strain 1716" /NCGR_SAMPLE_ID=MMETSP0013_2 /ASSEMBLY_ACC=CAM_ASM_000158 /LENGTH=718 /DNA_ID=CAMNT_0000301713 /DNA_START=8 /DNA_END=2164 /DNA_ORIENTATION=- /assembly_acc=CAM_ASM_000158